MIYADNAATTKLDADAFEAMKPYLLDSYGNASQPYSFSRKPKKVLKQAREIIAACIGASPDEIFFTSGGTESDNWAIKGTMAYGDNRPIMTTNIEHHAILHACAAVERLGYPVVYLPVDATGIMLPTTLNEYITDNTKLVSVMMANNEIGTIEPIKELCEISHKQGALFHTDAVQAIGHIPIDVHQLDVDMLSASAHKFNGPKGVGFMYIKSGTKVYPFSDGGSQEFGLRAGTENVASIVGMATALQLNCGALMKNQHYIHGLEMSLLRYLEDIGIPYTRNGSNNTLPGLLSLSFIGLGGEAILHRMDLMGISIATGSACNSINTEISHVLQAIQLDERLARGTIRISLGKNNTEDDVKTIAYALKKLLR